MYKKNFKEKITAQNSTNQSTLDKILNLINTGIVRWGTFGDCWVYLFLHDELFVTSRIPLNYSYEKILSNMVTLNEDEASISIRAHKRVYNMNENNIEIALNILWAKDNEYYFVNLDWQDRYDFLYSN